MGIERKIGAGQLLTHEKANIQLQSMGASLLDREGRAAARHPGEEASLGAQCQEKMQRIELGR